MSRRPVAAQRAYRDVLQRALNLPTRDQLALYEFLLSYLAGHIGEETAANRQLRLRDEALATIERVAKHLGLPDGEAPRVTDFNRACRELGIPWRSHHVIRAFGRWNNAKNAYGGRRVPETASQRSLRRATAGRKRTHEEYFEGVRIWLQARPASTRRGDYAAFRAEYNAKLPAGQRPLVGVWMLTAELGLGWDQVLAIARGEKTVEQAWREREAGTDKRSSGAGAEQATTRSSGRRKAPWDELVSAREAAAMLGLAHSQFDDHSRRRSFPLPAARLGSARVWRRVDIETYRDGGTRFRTKRENELQGEIMDAHEVRRRLGIDQKLLTLRLRREQYHLVPKPTGRVGGWIYYWRRRDAERWFERHERER